MFEVSVVIVVMVYSHFKPKQIPCLMPLLDMANHSFVEESPIRPGYSDMKDVAVLPLNSSVRKGQVRLSSQLQK